MYANVYTDMYTLFNLYYQIYTLCIIRCIQYNLDWTLSLCTITRICINSDVYTDVYTVYYQSYTNCIYNVSGTGSVILHTPQLPKTKKIRYLGGIKMALLHRKSIQTTPQNEGRITSETHLATPKCFCGHFEQGTKFSM